MLPKQQQFSFLFFDPISLELAPFAGLPFGNTCWSPAVFLYQGVF